MQEQWDVGLLKFNSLLFCIKKNIHNWHKLESELGLLKPLLTTDQKCQNWRMATIARKFNLSFTENGGQMDIYNDNAKFMLHFNQPTQISCNLNKFVCIAR